jgi:hypothetical protein
MVTHNTCQYSKYVNFQVCLVILTLAQGLKKHYNNMAVYNCF